MPIYIPKSPPTVVLLGLISAASVSLALAAQPKESGQSGASQPAASQQQGGATQQGSSARASTSGTSGSAAGTESAQAMSGKLSRSDEKLLVQLAQANLAEINAGKLAQQKSENDRVKSYAQKMVDDHTKALDDLKQIAQSKGVTLPTEPNKQQMAMEHKLQGLSGDKFDKQYMKQAGDRAHKQTHQLLQKAEKASDTDLKNYASKTIAAVEGHQQMAKETERSLKGTATGKSGGGTTGSGEESSGKSGHGKTKSGHDKSKSSGSSSGGSESTGGASSSSGTSGGGTSSSGSTGDTSGTSGSSTGGASSSGTSGAGTPSSGTSGGGATSSGTSK